MTDRLLNLEWAVLRTDHTWYRENQTALWKYGDEEPTSLTAEWVKDVPVVNYTWIEAVVFLGFYEPEEDWDIGWNDELLEAAWEAFDTPIDEDECIDEDFIFHGIVLFSKGTDREAIWHWFDERHSVGLHFLMFGEGD